MKVLIILIIIISFISDLNAGNITEQVRKSYEERANFIKDYISTIKENRKKDKKFKGSVVESVSGRLFTRWGPFSQKTLDKNALDDCKEAGELDCLVRFRTLTKNSNYNRYAKYDSSKKSLKVLGEFIKSKKVFTTRGIDVLISEENFKNSRNFFVAKPNQIIEKL